MLKVGIEDSWNLQFILTIVTINKLKSRLKVICHLDDKTYECRGSLKLDVEVITIHDTC